MGKITNTFELMGAAWRILRQDKELLVFPLLSGVFCLIVVGSFMLPLFGADSQIADDGSGAPFNNYILLFLFYFINYFIITFFNSAVVFCAIMRMDGKNPTLAHGFAAAFERIGLIFGWAALSATVGMILRIIEERSSWAGQLAAGLAGMAWSIASYLAVPILVVEKKSPIDALKSSAALLKNTWGQQLIGNFSFGLVFMLLGIPGVIIIVLGALAADSAAVITAVILAVLYFIILALAQSCLMSIFQAALYLYARDRSSGRTPPGFDSTLLGNAISPK
ncbi:DUF6159 family protein [Calditrichota bacterium]